MSEETGCSCGKVQYNMVFACSGAADVGAVSDQAARRLAREKTAMMCCTAAIGAQIPDIVEKARGASKTVVIDGCDKECAREILEKNGFSGFAHVQLEALGMEKGKSPVNEARVAFAAGKAAELTAE
jgi:uncharacterized metal-binding protein